MRQKTKRHITNKEVAFLLKSVAAAHLIKNKNRFRILAYDNAADAVEHLTREVYDIWQEGKLKNVSGIGAVIADSLDEYFKKGKSKHFEDVKKGIPETVFELMKVPTIGPKKAFKLVKELRLEKTKTLFDEIKKNAAKGKIASIPTFGKKSQEQILSAVERYEGRSQEHHFRMPLPYADRLAQEVVNYLRKNKNVGRIDVLGSLRRRVVTIGDIDIAVTCENGKETGIIEHFKRFSKSVATYNSGTKKASIVLSSQIRIDLRVQDEETYGSMLQYFTGSKEHNIRLREFALKKKYSLSEYGIRDLRRNKLYEFANEEDFYHFLLLDYIPPEIREGTIEIEAAKRKILPKLVELGDIRGDFHVHSNYDLKPSHDLGSDSYVTLVKKAKRLGYEYIGFSDHNPRQSDLKEEEVISILKKRKEKISKVLHGQKVDSYVGLETDILPNGKLALPKKALPYVDYLIVSVHSSFHMDIDEMTKRVLTALDNPKIKILGHPTGRLLGKREGYEMHWRKIFEKCKKKDIALEINSWPERLDLPDSLVYEATQLGCSFIINTDAHAVSHMENMPFGVAVARRGWLTKHDIINTKPRDFVKEWITKGR